MPYQGFKPLIGGGPQRPEPTGRPLGRTTKSGLTATANASDDGADAAMAARSTEPALRSTFVDKEEAAMLRAMARLNGDDAARRAGNSFSATNRVKLKARAEEATAMGLAPLDPHEQHELHRKMQAGYTTISQRAVRVPKVGQRQRSRDFAPIDFVSHRKSEDEIRHETNNFTLPQAPPGRLFESSDEKKDALALRNQFKGMTPQEILAEQRPPPKPKSADARASGSTLRQQIEEEVAERQEFLDAMRAMGRGAEHEAVISGEIRDRLNDLKALDRLEGAEERSGGGDDVS